MTTQLTIEQFADAIYVRSCFIKFMRAKYNSDYWYMFASKSDLDEFEKIRQPINDNLINEPIIKILKNYSDYEQFTKDYSPLHRLFETA